ncbi:PREDICTED: tRNA pseudouridine synthase A, mitochondrial isoform X1 [Nicrophorus vespilloides]|uniref:tRNA pseudouridine synthase A, mitochondrial isoform X1 n=2 Tax=Nicrophorus vespilloides TaxID=110193 RepID=A0ABM1MQJ1_NICVS|nr:PREDICTED: tRNA pseudouridine synthase A, mitochondrial isoform X1 [Nicrophorus vespilloides]
MFLIKSLINIRPANVNVYKHLTNNYSALSMSEIKNTIRKARYDGRTKKRKWEDRRADQGAGLDMKQARTEPFERVKRRKFAVLMAYSGVNFYGMQRNPQMPTIEESFFNALLKADFITQDGYNQVQTVQFQRAARTDKGVSAARQIISMKLPEAFEIEKVNEHLPETIRVFGSRRVTKGFNSKVQCDARTYMYMLPTVAFAPFDEEVSQETYTLSDDRYEKIKALLGKFVGTKNFHNYTSKKRYNDPSASRYIMSFTCDPPIKINGVEFVVVKVKGQSFMLHQIRKMVGITLAVIRGHTTEETFDKSFLKEKVNVPRAPGLGLVLEYVHYDRYNARYGSDHDKLLWEEENETVEAFKKKYIYPTIVDTEIKDKAMIDWLTCLMIHRYDIPDETEANDDESVESGDEVEVQKKDEDNISDNDGNKISENK